MEGENAEEPSIEPSQVEDSTPSDQTIASQLVESLLPTNNQEPTNPTNEEELQTQNQAAENDENHTQDEVTQRVDGLLPSNDNENTLPQQAEEANQQQSLENETEPTNNESQPTEQEIQSANTNNDTIQNTNVEEQQEISQNQPNEPPTSAEANADADQNEASTPQVAMPNTARVSSHAPRHFYPSMPQTARSGRSCRFVKTCPGTSRTNPYISRKISSFAVPLVQLRSAYQAMDTQLHSLVANCNIEAISPELMMVYKRVDKAYDIFCTQSNLLLSSQDPNATPRTQEKTSAIYKVSEELVNEWVTFIRLFNNTIAKGSTPFFQIISGRLSRILSMFRSLNERFNIGMMKIAFTRDGMRRVDSDIVLLRRECNAKYRNDEKIDQEFADKIKKVIARVENVFKNSVTKATMYTAEIMRLKSELHVEASDLKTNVDAMVIFDKSAGLTRAEIANVNEVFNSLFQLMRLPLELKLKYEDEMSENEKMLTKNEEEKTKNIETVNADPNKKVRLNNSMKVCMFENMV